MSNVTFETTASEFHKATGVLAPGKDDRNPPSVEHLKHRLWEQWRLYQVCSLEVERYAELLSDIQRECDQTDDADATVNKVSQMIEGFRHR